MNYRQIEKLLRKNGWKEVRTRGDHHQFKHPDGRFVTVPDRKDYCIGTLKSIEKSTGLLLRK
ncbi:MAG: type II toxin-antitoxin system HicA family toxin [Lachnospiraceae bacterium]|nr:type II toxin-antitoxin system HicA family toxin [Lachnospiraceae bacterium]